MGARQNPDQRSAVQINDHAAISLFVVITPTPPPDPLFKPRLVFVASGRCNKYLEVEAQLMSKTLN